MKLFHILLTWLIVSIPAAIVLGRFCAVGDSLWADTLSPPEQESDTLSEIKTPEKHSVKEAA